MATHRRLAICLDGTWNREDSSTNILHHFNLISEGAVEDGFSQEKFYHLGIGTGVLDSVTGGGLGIGLEQNVRDAYNWLIANFRDSPNGDADEIYIFGFSRGAYTARSLVGFIAQCGLLRRGAPLTVEQLWSAYCLLGRQKENRESIWEKRLGTEKPKVRAYTDLQHASDLNSDERLMLTWSRRVSITYLGLYDTVGAIGLDALAIPGLTSRMALHNNVRPTTIIRHCRHALAIDENRSNFNHTPFIAYLQEDSEEVRRVEHAQTGSQSSIDQNRKMWEKKIQQRWFVGAHSNLGGGYDNNVLAQLPLHWILDGAQALGLQAESLPAAAHVIPTESQPHDSYADFVSPLWDTIIRNKRNYRLINPNSKLYAPANGLGHGYALETIDEQLDSSVLTYWQEAKRPIPPNLECYLKRTSPASLASILQPAQHVWLAESLFPYVAIVVWASVATFGIYALRLLIGLAADFPWWLSYLIAFALPFVDWAESKVNFGYAVGAGGPRAQAFLDAVYWVRTVGFALFTLGLVYGVWFLLAAGWHSYDQPSNVAWELLLPVLCVSALPALIITRLRSKSAWIAVVLGPLAAILMAACLIGLAFAIHQLFPESAQLPSQAVLVNQPSLPGLLLLLQLAALIFWRSFSWVGEPLAQTNLGSIVKLQLCWAPTQVIACLDGWRDRLANTRTPDKSRTGQAANNLREILRHALWRDTIGFIPVYTAFLLFALWFLNNLRVLAAELPHGAPLALAKWFGPPVPFVRFWWVLPVLSAATDYLENFCHLKYLRIYENQDAKPSSVLTAVSFAMTLTKDVCFFTSLVIAAGGIVLGSFFVVNDLVDWRAKIAVSLPAVALLFLIAIVAKAIRTYKHRPTDIQKASDPGNGVSNAGTISAQG